MLKESNTQSLFSTAICHTCPYFSRGLWTACQKNLACPLEIFSPMLLVWGSALGTKGSRNTLKGLTETKVLYKMKNT